MVTRALFTSILGALILAGQPAKASMTASFSGQYSNFNPAVSPTTVYFSNISGTAQNPASPVTINGVKWYVDNGGTGACTQFLNPANGNNAGCLLSTAGLTITATTSIAPTGSANMYLIESATGQPSGALASNITGAGQQPYVAGQAISWTIPYKNICAQWAILNPTGNIDSNCHDIRWNTSPQPTIITIYIVADTNGNGVYDAGVDDTTAITVKIASSIPAQAVPNVAGFWGFTVFPGDSKVYIRSPSEEAYFPGSVNNSVGAQIVRFYFASSTNPNYDVTQFAQIDPSTGFTQHQDVAFDSSGNLATTAILPLNNGTNYYFRATTIDNAGNIGYLTVDDSKQRTAIPDQVFGLLKNKTNCFVATAAFGSPMARQVQILRDFRDKILLKRGAGRAFVNWYYAHGPYWAHKIENHDDVRFVVRLLLYPLIGFSYLALIVGAYNASLAFATLLILPLLITTWIKTSRRMRKAQ